MGQQSRRAPRSDGMDNRARILRTASAAFTRDPTASLQSIAKASGVGQGTMYRHFPSRESLLLAVYRQDVEALIASAARLLAERDPLDALREWLSQLAAYGRIKHGASLAIEAATQASLGGEYYPPVIDALSNLLDAAKARGEVREDADPDDVLILVSFLWKTDSGPEWQPKSNRMLQIVLDGLRFQPTRSEGDGGAGLSQS
jgi:AcrR family transcriptional regulator